MIRLKNCLSVKTDWWGQNIKKVSLVFFLCLVAVAGWKLFSNLDQVVYQCDEYSYLRKSFFLGLFLTGNFSDERWQSGDATDQTKLMEYIYGLPSEVLYGETFLDLAGKEGARSGESYLNYSDWAVTYGQPALQLKVSFRLKQVLWLGRVISTTFTVTYLLLVSITLYWVFKKSLLLAGLGWGVLLFHPIILIHGRQVLADSALNTFLVLGLLVQLFWWRILWRLKKPNRELVLLAVTLGLIGGLAAATKLNGFLHLITTELLMGLGLILKLKKTKQVKLWLVPLFLSAATVAAVALAVFFSLHPNTWNDPIDGLRKFLEWRWWLTEYYQGYFPEDNIGSLAEKMRFILLRTAGYMPGVGSIGFHYENRYESLSPLWYGLPNIFLFTLGIVGFGRKLLVGKKYQDLIFPAVVWSLSTILIVSWYLKLDWTRYYWPLFLPVLIVNSLGLTFLGKQLTKIWPKNR